MFSSEISEVKSLPLFLSLFPLGLDYEMSEFLDQFGHFPPTVLPWVCPGPVPQGGRMSRVPLSFKPSDAAGIWDEALVQTQN